MKCAKVMNGLSDLVDQDLRIATFAQVVWHRQNLQTNTSYVRRGNDLATKAMRTNQVTKVSYANCVR